MTTLAGVMTWSDLLRATGLPGHKLRYLIQSRGIQPVARVNHMHLYDPAIVDQITQAAARRQRNTTHIGD